MVLTSILLEISFMLGTFNAFLFVALLTIIAISSGDIAWVWDYDPKAMTATNKRTLVTG